MEIRLSGGYYRERTAVSSSPVDHEEEKILVRQPPHSGSLTIPMAASSAIMAEMVWAEVSPGTAIISRPTEQTQVIASSLSSVRAPDRAAAIIPSSSLTGMKAPDRPPTEEGGHDAPL